MGNVGLGELMVIGLIVLLIFGPNKLPEMMRSFGKAIRVFQEESRKAANVLKEGFEEPTPAAGVIDKPDTAPPIPPPAPPAEPTQVTQNEEPTRRYEDT
jgi:sec-independent protein translocase protein TatA